MKDVPQEIEAVWKMESTRPIAAIARFTPDMGTQTQMEKARSINLGAVQS